MATLEVACRMNRPPIPAELRRAVLVEAGHRCAIPRCGNTQLDIHHIVPWESCKRHEYSNLIALCPNCHRRAHDNDIDRKSLRLYKSQLIADFYSTDSTQFAAPIIEIKRRLREIRPALPDFAPGIDFAFDFPDFQAPAARIVSRNLEAWGAELLLEYRQRQEHADPSIEFSGMPYWLRGTYEIARNDSSVISVRYNLSQMAPGAAHRNTETRVQNYLVSPFRPLTLDELLRTRSKLERIAELCRASLLSQSDIPLQKEDVIRGTTPEWDNFSLFDIGPFALRFIFREYQVGCYAVGQQYVSFGFYELRDVIDPEILDVLSRESDF